MLQASGRLGTHGWRLGGTYRRLGCTSGLSVTGDLLANSVLVRHVPGSLEALYPEAWLEHRMDSEEQAAQQTEEIRLTQLTLKLALELSQYFLTEAEKPQIMQTTSISQTLMTCLTALETQNRALTRELRRQVELLFRSREQTTLHDRTAVIRERITGHTDAVVYENSEKHTDTIVREETQRHTDAVIRTEHTERAEWILRAEQLRQYTEMCLVELEREHPALRGGLTDRAGETVILAAPEQRAPAHETARRPAEAVAIPAAGEIRTLTMLPPPAWSRDMTAYRRRGPEQSGIETHRRKLLTLLAETPEEEQEILWRELRSETELIDLCRRVEQTEETEVSYLTRLVRETTNHEYIRFFHTLEKRFSGRVSRNTLNEIEETQSVSNFRLEGVSLEQVIHNEKEILTQRAAPMLERLAQTLKAGRVQREKMLTQMTEYPEAARLAFLTLAHDSGIFTETSLPGRQGSTAEEQMTVLVRKSSRRELEELVRWVSEQPATAPKQNEPVIKTKDITRSEIVNTTRNLTRSETVNPERTLAQTETITTARELTQTETIHSATSIAQTEAIRTARNIALMETAHLQHSDAQMGTLVSGQTEQMPGAVPERPNEWGAMAEDEENVLVLQQKTAVSEVIARFLEQNPLQQLQRSEHGGTGSAQVSVETKAEVSAAGGAVKAADLRSESEAWEGTLLRRRLSHREIETVAETIRERTEELEKRPNTPEQRRKQMREKLTAAATPPVERAVLPERALKLWTETAENYRTLHEDTKIFRENVRREHIAEGVEWIDSDTAMVLRELSQSRPRTEPMQASVPMVQSGDKSMTPAPVQERNMDRTSGKNREITEKTVQKTALRRLADSRRVQSETVETTLQAIRNLVFTDHVLRRQEHTLRSGWTETAAVSVTHEEDLGTSIAIESSEHILRRHTHLSRKHQTEEKKSLLHSSLMSRETMLQTLRSAERVVERETLAVREERAIQTQQIRDLKVQEEALRQDVVRREHILRKQKILETERESERRIRTEGQELVLSGKRTIRSEQEQQLLTEEREISLRWQMLLHLEEQLRVIRNQTALRRETVYTPDLSREDYTVLRRTAPVSRELGVMNRRIRIIERYHAPIRTTERLAVQKLYTSEAQSFAAMVQEGELQVFRAPAASSQPEETVTSRRQMSISAAPSTGAEIHRAATARNKAAAAKIMPPKRQESLSLSGEVGLELRRTQKPEAVRETAVQTAREVVEATIRQQDPELRVLRRQSQEQEKVLSRQREEIGGLRQQLEKQEELVRQSMERTVQTEDNPGQIRKLAKAVMRELEDQLRLERQRRGMM